MKIEERFDFKVCVLDSLDEMSSLDTSCDFVEIEGKYPEFGFVRPKKISWRAYLKDFTDSYRVVHSSKLRKNLKKWISHMESEGIVFRVSEPLADELFSEWITLYKNHLGKKDRANIAIDETWLSRKVEKGKKTAGLFLYHNDQLIGGNVMTLEEKKLSVGFGTAEKVTGLDWNLGALLDFLTIQYGMEKGYEVVSFGQDTNLYGQHLLAGLFSYKARLGLTPEPVEKQGWVTTKFLRFDKFMDPIVFMREGYILQILYKDRKPVAMEYFADGIISVNVERVRYD